MPRHGLPRDTRTLCDRKEREGESIRLRFTTKFSNRILLSSAQRGIVKCESAKAERRVGVCIGGRAASWPGT